MQEDEFIEEIAESFKAVDIGRNIRKIRRKACMSQEVFAERIGVSRQTVVKRERGYSLPAADKVGNIIKECSATIEEILGTEVEPIKEECIAGAEEKVCEKPEKKNKISISKVFAITFLSATAVLILFVLVSIIFIMISRINSAAFAISSVISLGDKEKLILAVSGCILVLTCVVIGIVKLINFRRGKMKHKKFAIAILMVMICIVMIGGISTVAAEENNAGTRGFSLENVEAKGIYVVVAVDLIGNGDGTVTARAKNEFTLGNTGLAVIVELYASVDFPMDYTEMQKVAWQETYDLNIFDTLSATSPTKGQQKYWCARVMYNKDGEGWKSDVTPIVLLDANGNKVNT